MKKEVAFFLIGGKHVVGRVGTNLVVKAFNILKDSKFELRNMGERLAGT